MSLPVPYNFAILLVLTSILVSGLAYDQNNEHEHKNYEVYFDENWTPLPLLATGNMTTAQHQRLPLRRYGIMPCECMELQCGCCVNTNFFSTKRSGCMNMTYDPDEFAIGMNMLWNGESVYQNTLSAKNPPPACMEAPIPYLPSMQFCIRLYDIYTPGRNIHMCVNFETRIARAPILVLEFDCFQMGWDGLDYLKPNSSTTRPIIENPLSGLVAGGEESGTGGGEESGSEGAASDDQITPSPADVSTGVAPADGVTLSDANKSTGTAITDKVASPHANISAEVASTNTGTSPHAIISAGTASTDKVTSPHANIPWRKETIVPTRMASDVHHHIPNQVPGPSLIVHHSQPNLTAVSKTNDKLT